MPEEPRDAGLGDGHMFSEYLKMVQQHFTEGTEKEWASGSVTFGVEPMQRPDDFDKFKPAENRGHVGFSPGFDFYSHASLLKFREVCKLVRKWPCAECAPQTMCKGGRNNCQSQRLYVRQDILREIEVEGLSVPGRHVLAG